MKSKRVFMSHLFTFIFLSAFAVSTPVSAVAEEVQINLQDLHASLESLKGKDVTLQLSSGQEISGRILEVTAKMARLSSLKGREFFDAVVPLDQIAAVVLRVRG